MAYVVSKPNNKLFIPHTKGNEEKKMTERDAEISHAPILCHTRQKKKQTESGSFTLDPLPFSPFT